MLIRLRRFSTLSRSGLGLGVLVLLLLTSSRGSPDAIHGSRHDLSSPSPPESNRVCVFCHTPHHANRVLGAPLWNRFVDRSKVFSPYSSPTLNTLPGDPNDSLESILCLGCHDGTLGTAVVGSFSGSDKHDLVNAPGPGGVPDTTSYPNCERCHTEIYYGRPAKWVGTDLSNDHPISMAYPTAVQDPAFVLPPDAANGWPDVPLFGAKVECATCHNPHDPGLVPFLRRDNLGSQLCLRCHVK